MQYEKTFQRLRDAMNNNRLPWRKPWTGIDSLPTRSTGQRYQGANILLLSLVATVEGYTQPEWMTFKQCSALGGKIKKGSKGSPIVFWSTITKEDKETGKQKSFGFYKTYTVFNLEQTEGLEHRFKTLQTNDTPHIAECEHFATATRADIQIKGQKACYIPAQDKILMPDIKLFTDSESYYSTLFHELGHWTGHHSRLDRKADLEHTYAFEELVAELTSALTCAHLGISNEDQTNNAAAYLKHWLKMLNEKPKMFLSACSKAQKAFEHLASYSKTEYKQVA